MLYNDVHSHFAEFLKNPSLKALRDGTAPGSKYPEVRKALIKVVCDKLDIDPKFRENPAVQNFCQSLDVDGLLTAKLGEFLPAKERTIKHIGRLATQDSSLYMRSKFTFDETESPFDFFAKAAVRGSKSDTAVSFRPVSQPDERPRTIYDISIDRTANGQELEPEEYAELETLLGKFVAK